MSAKATKWLVALRHSENPASTYYLTQFLSNEGDNSVINAAFSCRTKSDAMQFSRSIASKIATMFNIINNLDTVIFDQKIQMVHTIERASVLGGEPGPKQ